MRNRALRYVPLIAVLLLAAAATLAAACGDDGADTVPVTGIVEKGPVCPVERRPPDPECADRPVEGAEIRVIGGSGKTVAVARSAADGTFTVDLEPGTYRFEPQPVEGLLGTAPAADVTVTADGGPAGLRFLYDTGIR